MSSERNVWTPDDDPGVAAHEAALTRLHQLPIMGMHADLHRLLDLPRIPRRHIRDAYKTRTTNPIQLIAKAPADPDDAARQAAISTAYTRFRNLAAMNRLGPEHAEAIADTLTTKWYGQGRLRTDGEKRAVRAYVAGRIRENPREPPPARLPDTARDVAAMYDLSVPQARALEWAAAHTGEHVTAMGDRAKGKLRDLVILSQREREHPEALARRMLDNMATLNRDWRMIALTETHSNHAHGQLAALIGQNVRWRAADDACPYCRQYHGREFAVLDASDPRRNHHLNVWPGKTNVGRSFARHTIDGRERTLDELAGPTIPAHPHCRCAWDRILATARPDDDPRLTEFIRKRLAA